MTPSPCSLTNLGTSSIMTRPHSCMPIVWVAKDRRVGRFADESALMLMRLPWFLTLWYVNVVAEYLLLPTLSLICLRTRHTNFVAAPGTRSRDKLCIIELGVYADFIGRQFCCGTRHLVVGRTVRYWTRCSCRFNLFTLCRKVYGV